MHKLQQCVLLQETSDNDVPLYAKIGCVDRETFTSTKLQLHVYTDNQCSQPYDDGETNKRHATNGYDINGYIFPTRVSFRPPFYTCDTCTPDQISDSFNKANSNWYDDYYINNQEEDNDDADDAYKQANDDVQRDDDAYKNKAGDDAYYAADDGNNNDDGGNNNKYNNRNRYNYKNYNNNNAQNGQYYNFNDDYYNTDDGGRVRHRYLERAEDIVLSNAMAAPEQMEVSHMLAVFLIYRFCRHTTDPSFQIPRRLFTTNFGVPTMT